MAFGLGAPFNEPPTDDMTSAPPMQQQLSSPTPQKKKKQLKLKNPAPLAAAIARSRRAFQGSHKYGS